MGSGRDGKRLDAALGAVLQRLSSRNGINGGKKETEEERLEREAEEKEEREDQERRELEEQERLKRKQERLLKEPLQRKRSRCCAVFEEDADEDEDGDDW